MNTAPVHPIPEWLPDEEPSDLEFLGGLDGNDLYVGMRDDERLFIQVGTKVPDWVRAGYCVTSPPGWTSTHVNSWDWSTPAIREFAKAFFALHA